MAPVLTGAGACAEHQGLERRELVTVKAMGVRGTNFGYSPYMGAALMYVSPFIDIAPHGPGALFTSDEEDQLVAILDNVRASVVDA